MLNKLVKKIFGSRNDRLVKRMLKSVEQINVLEPAMEALSDEALRAKTDEFRERVANGETTRRPAARGLCGRPRGRQAGARHASFRRADDRRHGAATRARSPRCAPARARPWSRRCAVYLNALAGKGVHVVTVNDYLARRDAGWMGRLYDFLGLTTGVINSSGGMGPDSSSYSWTWLPGRHRWFQHLRPVSEARPTPATSPTAPTTNSASTTCATTWRLPPSSGCSAR